MKGTPVLWLLLLCVALFVAWGAPTRVAAGGTGAYVNLAQGAPYWLNRPADSTYPDTGSELTDGIKGSADYADGAWQGHLRNEWRVITVDLGAPKRIDEVRIGFLFDPEPNIRLPDAITLYTSVNGRDWSAPQRKSGSAVGMPVRIGRHEVTFDWLYRTARYVRVVVHFNVWAFIDEIEVWGGDRTVHAEEPTDGLDMADPLLGLVPDPRTAGYDTGRRPAHVVGRYAAAGSAKAGGAEHIALIYTHHTWHVAEALPYVAYRPPTADGPGWDDWFFDTFLFLSLRNDAGYAFDAPSRGTPAPWREWLAFLDDLFGPGKQLAAFDEAVATAKNSILDAGYKAKVIVMIPYPMPDTTRFGDPLGLGRPLEFSPFPQRLSQSIDDRVAAVQIYMDEFFGRWEKAAYEHLELVGMYWLAEAAPGMTDFALINEVAPLVRNRGLRLFWIPYYGAPGWANWQELGFDQAIYQPNYMFDAGIPPTRFAQAADGARRHGLGIEIEADDTVLRSAIYRRRYLDYLKAGVEHGWMGESLHGYYQSGNVLGQAFASADPAVRRVYDATYEYVKGVYDPADDAE